MKRKFIISTLFILILILSTTIYAATEYEFKLEYTGNIVVGEQKEAEVILSGTEATPYSNVRIKIEFVSGPSTPTILATDTNGNEFNLTEIGFWGPEDGFQVGGTFTNRTPIKALYSKAGTYVSKLSLIDVSNGNAVIASNEFTITVTESSQNNAVTNTNNEISNLPETGTNILDYIILVVIIGATLFIIYAITRKVKK